jgi:mono/diheme cytochrome c family protein
MRDHYKINCRLTTTSMWKIIALTLISGLISLACSARQTTTTPSPEASPAASPTAAETTAASNVTETTKNPLTDLAAAAQAGKPLYEANCADCHGKTGKGDGPLAESIEHKPADLTQGDVPADPDGELFLVIKNGKMKEGKVSMPPAKKLTDEQIWQVVAYVRTLAKK